MLFVPLPFVVALLLLLLFVAVVRRDDELAANRPFLVLVLLCAVQSVLVGLRLGYGLQWIGYLALVIPTVMPPLVYAGVRKLGVDSPRRWPALLGFYSFPAVVVAVLVVVWPEAIDIAMILIQIAYALALLWLVRPGPNALRLASFEAAQPAHRSACLCCRCIVLLGDDRCAGAILISGGPHGAHVGMDRQYRQSSWPVHTRGCCSELPAGAPQTPETWISSLRTTPPEDKEYDCQNS